MGRYVVSVLQVAYPATLYMLFLEVYHLRPRMRVESLLINKTFSILINKPSNFINRVSKNNSLSINYFNLTNLEEDIFLDGSAKEFMLEMPELKKISHTIALKDLIPADVSISLAKIRGSLFYWVYFYFLINRVTTKLNSFSVAF